MGDRVWVMPLTVHFLVYTSVLDWVGACRGRTRRMLKFFNPRRPEVQQTPSVNETELRVKESVPMGECAPRRWDTAQESRVLSRNQRTGSQ